MSRGKALGIVFARIMFGRTMRAIIKRMRRNCLQCQVPASLFVVWRCVADDQRIEIGSRVLVHAERNRAAQRQ
jgi:hypothetical protein